MLGRRLVGRGVDDGRRVEDDEVGRATFTDDAAVGQPERSAGTDVILAMAVSSDATPRSRTYLPEDPRRRAIRPRVRNPGAEDRMAWAAAFGIGADGDPGHGHDRLDVLFGHAVDDDATSSRSSSRASKASSAGSTSKLSPSSASERPDQSGWLAANEIRMPAQPGSAATFSQPEIPRSIST